MRLSSDLVERMCGDLLLEFGGSIPSGDVRLDSLPEELRKGLLDQMSARWQMHGYASKEDMSVALSTIEYVDIRPQFSFQFAKEYKPGKHYFTSIGFYVGP